MVCFRRQIPTAFETELVPSLKITDEKYLSVIPLVLSDFLVVHIKSCLFLRRCRFQNRQPQTMSLPIQESTSNDYFAANSEIGNQKLRRCLFRNRQPKITSLPI
jgi:hypothetical protein